MENPDNLAQKQDKLLTEIHHLVDKRANTAASRFGSLRPR